MKKMKRISLLLLCLLLSAVCLLSVAMVWKEYTGRNKDRCAFEDLVQIAEKADSDEAGQTPDDESAKSVQTNDKRNLATLMERNSDCIGWLCILGTAVNYPVMHTPQEPQKYLRKNFDGKYSVSGVPFLDCRCNLDSDNLILYGHNMKNGTMFSAVTEYANEKYQREHPTIELETPKGLRIYKVFAAATVKKTDRWYTFLAAEKEETYRAAVAEILTKARYDTGIVPEFGQQLLTLSTCYGGNKDDRLIVVAVCEDNISKTNL